MEEKQKSNNTKDKKSEKFEKKRIFPRTAVKALINGFVAYGILVLFIFLTIVVLVTWVVDNNMDKIDYNVLKYSLPLLASFVIFFLVRATCRLSTFDLFKKCKIEKDEVDKVCGKMNFFFVCLVFFSVITIIIYLITRFSNERVQINKNLMIYSQSNSFFVENKKQELIEEFEANRSNTLVQTLIIEMGLLLGIFSLIPNQRRLIERYNQ